MGKIMLGPWEAANIFGFSFMCVSFHEHTARVSYHFGTPQEENVGNFFVFPTRSFFVNISKPVGLREVGAVFTWFEHHELLHAIRFVSRRACLIFDG